MATRKALSYAVIANNWVGTAMTCKVGPVNAFVVFPALLFFLHVRWWTFYTLLATIVFIVFLDWKGYKPYVALLAIRSFIAGKKLPRGPRLGSKDLYK